MLGNGPHRLGNGLHGLGNGPYVLGNGLHLLSITGYVAIRDYVAFGIMSFSIMSHSGLYRSA